MNSSQIAPLIPMKNQAETITGKRNVHMCGVHVALFSLQPLLPYGLKEIQTKVFKICFLQGHFAIIKSLETLKKEF